MSDNFYQNASKPVGDDGKSILDRMNRSHASMAAWGQSHVNFEKNSHVLDIGCGGGANLAVFLKKCPDGIITGIDYSDVSVEESIKYNQNAYDEGRCRVLKGDVTDLRFDDESFDVVTAFETVYFWPNIKDAFKQVYRVLKKGGTFLICNETDDTSDDTYTKIIKGMTIYSKQKLKEISEDVGFLNVQVFAHEYEKWVCVTSSK